MTTPTRRGPGGSRPGAGRPTMSERGRAVRLTVALTPELHEWLRQQAAAHHVTIGEVIRRRLREVAP